MTIQLENFKAGEIRKSYQYSYFMPTTINHRWRWATSDINWLLEKAAIRIGELNAFARLVPNIDLFIQLHVTKEAVVSSRIEGTQTNINEALLPKEEITPERKDDWQEVKNYIRALNTAIEELKQLPVSSRLIKQTHKILLDSVRGEHKMPGEYRVSQNWIGGVSLADATFIPPHQDHVEMLMSDLEMFLHNDNIEMPDLIRIAIAHYQFETIHPFLDGNGRIGRLLITLYLISVGKLDQPLLYPSMFFDKNKLLYYDNLMLVRNKNNIYQWVKYFLVGIEQAATEAIDTLRKILHLKSSIEQDLDQQFGRRSQSAYKLFQHLFIDPIIDVDTAMTVCGTSYGPANELVAKMCKNGILKEITGQSRNRLFEFEPYLKIFDQFNER
ncbi:MAG: Fic family protein [Gammaproteobacteria bacterium]|nr:Fic family protein [Gammaproteobacteria bacterium]